MPWDRRRGRCFDRRNAPRVRRRFCRQRDLVRAREASIETGDRQNMRALWGMVRSGGQRGYHAWLAFCNRPLSWFRRLFFSARAWVVTILLLVVLVIVYYALSDRYTPFTTDAYVQAYVIQVAPRVEGEIVRVHVVENQRVGKGDVLFEIDPRPFAHRVELLEAKLVVSIQ